MTEQARELEVLEKRVGEDLNRTILVPAVAIFAMGTVVSFWPHLGVARDNMDIMAIYLMVSMYYASVVYHAFNAPNDTTCMISSNSAFVAFVAQIVVSIHALRLTIACFEYETGHYLLECDMMQFIPPSLALYIAFLLVPFAVMLYYSAWRLERDLPRLAEARAAEKARKSQ